MRQQKRKALVKAQIEKRLLKNERRIQQIAEESYKLRQLIKQIDDIEAQKPYAKPVEGE
jgi:hypothetical protein